MKDYKGINYCHGLKVLLCVLYIVRGKDNFFLYNREFYRLTKWLTLVSPIFSQTDIKLLMKSTEKAQCHVCSNVASYDKETIKLILVEKWFVKPPALTLKKHQCCEENK